MECDMLVKLWEVSDDVAIEIVKKLEAQDIYIKRAMSCDLREVKDFAITISPGWEGETIKGVLTNGCYIAVRKKEVLGFCCFDATLPDFVGPLGVREDVRGLGIGKALLLRSLVSMKEKGYAYAILGWTGPQEYYKKICGATCIEGSIPGSYRNLIRVDESQL